MITDPEVIGALVAYEESLLRRERRLFVGASICIALFVIAVFGFDSSINWQSVSLFVLQFAICVDILSVERCLSIIIILLLFRNSGVSDSTANTA